MIRLLSLSSHVDTPGVQGDATLIGSDSDVSPLAPRLSPGVLDDEELLPIGLGAVADGDDSVVEGPATASVNDTTSVISEPIVFGLDGDGDNPGVQPCSEALGIS